jgi:hypothetical protein
MLLAEHGGQRVKHHLGESEPIAMIPSTWPSRLAGRGARTGVSTSGMAVVGSNVETVIISLLYVNVSLCDILSF